MVGIPRWKPPDNVAADLGLGREESGHVRRSVLASAIAAKAAGFYDGEIHPISVFAGKNKPPRVVSEDEHPRAESDFKVLSKLGAFCSAAW